jgi:O-antigen ligase
LNAQSNFGYYAERIFVLVGLLLMMGALRGLFQDVSQSHGGTGSLTRGNFGFQVFSSAIYLVSLVGVLGSVGQLQQLFWRNKALLLLMALVLISAVWSIQPEVSLRRGIALTGTTIFALYLTVRIRPDELIKLLAWAFWLAAAASLFAVLFVPEVGLHNGGAHDGRWRGIFGHKNLFGRMMTLGGVLFFLLAWSRAAPRIFSWSGFLMCVLLVAMSQSVTSWITFAACLLLTFPLKILRDSNDSRTAFYALVLVVLGVIGLYVLLDNLEGALELIGRDATLSARTKIWALAFENGMKRPFFGYGYRVFWTQDNAGWLYGFLSWDAGFGHSHNGFIDLWLDLGTVGAGVFAVTLVTCWRRLIAHLGDSNDMTALWFPLGIAFIVITGLAERSILQQGTIEWVIYVSTLFYLSSPQAAETRAPSYA